MTTNWKELLENQKYIKESTVGIDNENGFLLGYEALEPLLLKALERLEDISILNPYPPSEKNIKRSHDRHLKIAKIVLAKIRKELEEK